MEPKLVDYIGTCPSCGESVSLGPTLSVVATCSACGSQSTVLAPEVGELPDGGEVPVTLMSSGPGARSPRPLPRPFWQLGRIAVTGVAASILALALVLVLALVESVLKADSGSELPVTVAAFAAMLQIAVVSAVATGLLWFLLGSRGRREPGFDPARSVIAILIGLGTMQAIGILSAFVWTRASDALPSLTFASAIASLTGLVGGWMISRLAPLAPFKHALALALAMPLAAAAFSIWTRTSERGFVALAYRPAILVGAWLSTRLRLRSA